MNRIGILTYHACNNYGASLQAFALQTTVRERCGDCEIIHYRSDVMREITRPFTKRPRHPKEFIKNVTRLPYRAALERRDRLFEEFTNEVLRVGPLCRTREEVIAQAERYDCIICGSDQIWNLDPGIRYQTPLFFLNFPKKQRRVAYAPSFSNWVKDAPTQEDVFLPWLRTFDALSVREESGAEYLRSLGLPCEVVLDPTLLLDRPAYDAIARAPSLDHPYILLFSWTMTREVCQAARRISAALGRKIISIVPPACDLRRVSAPARRRPAGVPRPRTERGFHRNKFLPRDGFFFALRKTLRLGLR